MEPIAKVSATLQTAQDNQARDISKLTNIMVNLNQKFNTILDRIPNIQTVATSPMLWSCVGSHNEAHMHDPSTFHHSNT